MKYWCEDYQISVKKPNKIFSINASARKNRIIDFLKNIWTLSYTLTNLCGVDPEFMMSNQILLHRNELSQEKTLNFKGAPQKTYVKENHSLSTERITAMTS